MLSEIDYTKKYERLDLCFDKDVTKTKNVYHKLPNSRIPLRNRITRNQYAKTDRMKSATANDTESNYSNEIKTKLRRKTAKPSMFQSTHFHCKNLQIAHHRNSICKTRSEIISTAHKELQNYRIFGRIIIDCEKSTRYATGIRKKHNRGVVWEAVLGEGSDRQ